MSFLGQGHPTLNPSPSRGGRRRANRQRFKHQGHYAVEVAHYLTIGDTQDAIAFAAQKSVSRLITLGSIADEVRIAIHLDNEP